MMFFKENKSLQTDLFSINLKAFTFFKYHPIYSFYSLFSCKISTIVFSVPIIPGEAISPI